MTAEEDEAVLKVRLRMSGWPEEDVVALVSWALTDRYADLEIKKAMTTTIMAGVSGGATFRSHALSNDDCHRLRILIKLRKANANV